MKKTYRAKDYLLWAYIAAVIVGIALAVFTRQKTKTPGDILYEKTQSFIKR